MTVDEFFEEYSQSEIVIYICKFIENKLSDTSFRLNVLSNFIPKDTFYSLKKNEDTYSDLIGSSKLKNKINDLLDERLYDYVLSFFKEKNFDEDVNLIFDIIDELDKDLLITTIIFTINNYLIDNRKDILEYAEKMKILQRSIDIDKIDDIKDEIGESSKITNRVDFYNRDSAFVDIDGEVLISNEGQSHGQLIQEWLNTFGDKKLEKEFFRPDENEVKELTNAKYSVFGHVVNDCIIIEEATLNDTSIEQVISDIKENNINYNKIYNLFGREVTRVAKLL